MKKVLFFMLLPALLLALAAPAGAAQTSHPHTAQGHCVCGGAAEGVGDHVCQTLTDWTPISGEVRFGSLESGNYYLSGDVTVKTADMIGKITNVGTTHATLEEERHIVLCLNGYCLTSSTSRVFTNIAMGSSLSVCDCSWDGTSFGGTVTGGSSIYGSITYLYASSVMNIYGGNWTMKAGTTNDQGGLFVLAQDRGSDANCKNDPAQRSVMNLYNGNIYAGSSRLGGNINVMHCSCFNMYGGTVSGGMATQQGGNIYVGQTAEMNLYGGTVSDGTAGEAYGNLRTAKTGTKLLGSVTVTGGSPEKAIALKKDGTLVGTYSTVSEAAAKGDYVRMMVDTEETSTVSGDLYIDLAGHTLSGLTVTGTVYGMDSTTDDYQADQAGVFSGQGTVAAHHKNDVTGAVKRYLAVQEEAGYSFHRFYMGITALSLKPDSVGMGYKAVVAGDDAVKENLSQYGYRIWMEGGKAVTQTRSADQFESRQTLTLRINRFLKEEIGVEANRQRADVPLYACIVFEMKDGTRIESSTAAYSFRDMVEAVNEDFSSYTLTQRNAVQSLSAKFSQVMIPWDISQFHHVTGGVWASKNQEAFLNLLTKDGYAYKIKAGSYVLTEDVDIGDKNLKVVAGDTVNICLNGHTITGSSRMFRNYGTLNFCDCHETGAEGNVISSEDAENTSCYGPVMYAYYNSTTNLYGGNLKAVNNADAAGVLAISHDGPTGTESLPAAVFNMYGGTVSGGHSLGDGGLISLWNGSTMNLYGGVLSGGSCDSHGGGISVGAKCTFNMYGGTVENNTAAGSGGNIMLNGNGSMNLYGGTITGGTAQYGAGIYMNGDMTLAGAPQVTGNQGQNLYLPYGNQLQQCDLEPDAGVGITAHTQMLIAEQSGTVQGLTDDTQTGTFQLKNGALFLSGDTLPAYGSTGGFTAGFGRRDITPTEDMKGLPLSGFGNDTARAWTEILDRLYATVIAVTDDQGETILLATFDLQAPRDGLRELIWKNISAATGVPEENIYLSATHTHSAPSVSRNTLEMQAYKSLVVEQFTLAALDAMADRQEATMYTGSFETEGLNFTRHYSYTDSNGVLKYFGDNFGTSTFNSTTAHVTENDPTMHMLKFDRAEKDILMVNWRAHPTRTGGVGKSQISSDFIGPLRDTMEADTGMYFAYFQGAAGNQNMWSRISSENSSVNYDHKLFGQELARQIINNQAALESIGTGLIQTESYTYTAAVNHDADDRIEDARYVTAHYWELDTQARRELLAEYNFTSVYHAGAVETKYSMGASKDLRMDVFAIGDKVGFYTVPGELWNTASVEMEEASPYATTFTVGYCNSDAAYFTYAEALTYESYESLYCRWVQPDSINDMMALWKEALNRLYSSQ